MHFRIYNFVTVKVKWNKSTIRHSKNLFLVKQNKQNILFVKTFRIDGAIKCESVFYMISKFVKYFYCFSNKGASMFFEVLIFERKTKLQSID
jgi:hypothetical protein